MTLVFDGFEQSARALCDDNGYVITSSFFSNDLFKRLNIEGIADGNVLDAERVAKLDEVDLTGCFASDSFACGGVILVTGHTGD